MPGFTLTNGLVAVAGAALASAAGVLLLYVSWRRLLAGVWAVSAGWLLLVLSAWLWVRATGAEFGLSLWLVCAAVMAWVLILVNAEIRPSRNRGLKSAQNAGVAARSIGRHAVVFVVAVPLAAVAATLASAALGDLLPWSLNNSLVFAILAMPALWGCAAYWAAADTRIVRPAAALIAGSVCSAAFLML